MAVLHQDGGAACGGGEAPSGGELRASADVAASPAPADQRLLSVQAIHLVRTVTTTNLTLSQMADQKASILMGATFVVFSLTVGQASKGQFPHALLALGFFAFFSAMFAVAAIIPATHGRPVPGMKPNLLFFGVFTAMEQEAFVETVMEQLATDERVMATMLRDIYQNGLVLQRKKYRFLGYAYRSFQLGLIVALLVFLFDNRHLFPGMAG